MNAARFCLTILLVSMTAVASAEGPRPKIGLALSGGGAKGFAHIGVLRVLEEMHVPIDYVAGTSIGAVVGALYASGMSPDEIEREVGIIDWDEALTDATSYRQLSFRRKEDAIRYPSTSEFGIKDGRFRTSIGIRTGQKLSFLLSRYLLPVLDEHDFHDFPIPFAAVAGDLTTGEAVVLSKGDIAESVRASMSIPAVFTPVEIDGRILVDGGIAKNVPVDVVRAMGADIVIAVDIGAPLYEKEQLQSTLTIIDQLSTMLTRSTVASQLADADVVISPEIRGISTFAFNDSKMIVPLGVKAAEEKRDVLRTIAIDPEQHGRILEKQRRPRARELMINEIRIVGNEFVDAGFLIEQLEVAIGKPLDLDALDRDIQWLYGSADFLGIHFGLEKLGDGAALVIRVQEKPWGPKYIRAGLSLDASTVQNVEVNLLLNYTRRWLNARGAEWRTDIKLGRNPVFQTEIYQPQRFDRPGFLRAGFLASEETIDLYLGNDVFSVYEVNRAQFYGDAGLVMSSLGEASVGVLYRWVDAAVTIGPPGFPAEKAHEGALTARLVLDSRDNPFIPVEGGYVDLNVVAPLEMLNSDEDHAWVTLAASWFLNLNRQTLWAGTRLADSLGGGPTLDFASLGGFNNLSGFAPNQLLGRASSLVQLGYHFQAKEIFPILGSGVYLGGVLEAGNVGESLDDALEELFISAAGFVAINTNYGPIYLGAAKAEVADWQYYLTIGKSF